MRQFAVEQVVPHAGTMSLLDNIIGYDDESLTAQVVITSDTLFLQEQGVPGWVGIEYMAQTIAAYAGVQRQLQGQQAQVGFLVGTRRYNCSHPYFPVGSVLNITIDVEFQADNGLSVCNCTIIGDNGIAADACLNVFQPDDVELFLQNDHD